jgi:sec-independent protein translocase protein TatA
MEALSPGHLLVIAIVAAVLLFGWRQLPEMARSLGHSLRILRTELRDTNTAAQHVRDNLADTRQTTRDALDTLVDSHSGNHPTT